MSFNYSYFLYFSIIFNYSDMFGIETINKIRLCYNNFLPKIFVRKFGSSTQLKQPIAGISFLKENNKKVVLLHDQHDHPEHIDVISQIHQQEITKLITRLRERKSKCSFYIEFPTQTKNFQIIQERSGIHIPIKDALKNNFFSGSIVYKPFDRRTENDFWLREMFINSNELDSALKAKTAIPKEFYDVSIKNYLYDLEKKKRASQRLIALLPAIIASKNTYKIDYITQMQFYIAILADRYQISLDNHFFDLFKKISLEPAQKNKLFLSLLQIQSIETDLSLAHSLNTESEETALIHAGAYHTHQVEKFLLHNKYQMKHQVKNGLNAQSLTNITWPTKFETTFAGQILDFIENK
ncbi:MAG: hypothetical protein ACOYT8_02040 [Candidatus Dependentiae bacterium]